MSPDRSDRPDRPERIALHLLRHADAGDPEAWPGPDADRPLSAKGEAQAERLATFLHGARFTTDALISSPKVRARRTAEIVADGLGAKVVIDDRLAEGVRPSTVDAILRDAGSPARVVLVGHDPDFSEILSMLAGAPGLSMKKGAFARVDVRGGVADGRGTLRWLIPPDLLDRDRR
ncbi:MAG TPA: histidine phosphatase family protein [Candidatus Limnocylindrales bacterium]|nr:histidine phosphatase family protein [Candidatus Limnocylindrales bacterium]